MCLNSVSACCTYPISRKPNRVKTYSEIEGQTVEVWANWGWFVGDNNPDFNSWSKTDSDLNSDSDRLEVQSGFRVPQNAEWIIMIIDFSWFASFFHYSHNNKIASSPKQFVSPWLKSAKDTVRRRKHSLDPDQCPLRLVLFIFPPTNPGTNPFPLEGGFYRDAAEPAAIPSFEFPFTERQILRSWQESRW